MAGRVCTDASLTLAILLREPLSAQARALWRTWSEGDVEIMAPPLFFAEVTSVLREHVHFERIEVEEGERLFRLLPEFGIRQHDPPELHPLAWELAQRYRRPRAYDAQYLAAAASLGCDLWTADERLVNAVGAPWVRWVGRY